MSKQNNIKKSIRKFFSIFLIAMTVTCVGMLSAQSHEGDEAHQEKKPDIEFQDKEISAELVYSSKVEETDILSGIKSSISSNGKQYANKGGINLTLSFKNSGTTDVELLNLLDFLRIRLNDYKGEIVRLPSAPSRFLINRGGRENKINLPFKVSSISIDGIFLDQSEINSHTFKLPINKVMTINLEIDRIIDPSDESGKKSIKIPSSKYKFKITALLVSALDTAVKHQIESPQIPVDLTN